jgi:hypothetical protein
MSSPLQNNITNLQNLLDKVNTLPEAGTDLPELTNEGSAADLLSGKQLIDQEGNIVEGTMTNNGTISSTMDGIGVKKITIPAGYTSGGTVSLDNTIDNEVNTQADLLTQIQAALQGKASASDPVLQSKTVTPSTSSQTVKPDAAYDGLSQVTVNAMPTATQATPSISVNSSGLITASVTQTAGYVAAGTKSATKQLTTQAAQIITPSTSDKTIESGRYLTGTQTIKGDSNLVSGNIKSGVSIFGVSGNYVGSGGSGDESVVAFTGTLSCAAPGGFTMTNTTFWYTDENMNAETFEATSGSDVPITIAKNTIVIHNSGVNKSCYGVEKVEVNIAGGAAYRVIADNFVISVM